MASISKLTESLALISTIDPDSYTADTYVSDEVNLADFKRVLFVLSCGDIGGSGTIDFEINGGASSNAGSHTTLVTGKSATQLTQAGSDANSQVIIEVSAEEAKAQGLQYLEAEIVIGTATSDVSLVVLGEPAHYSNSSALNLASVSEVIS